MHTFKNSIKIIVILFFLLGNLFLISTEKAWLQASKIELDSASVFYESGRQIHAITFNHNGLMFVGGKLDIFTISPDKSFKHFLTLKESAPNTIIWSMVFGSDGNLFIAANDRIVKVSPDGKQQVIIREDFSGPCGATDLRFDKQGNLYVVYDNIIARYDSSFKKTIFIDGTKFPTPIRWAVGIEFSSDEQYLYIGDCGGNNAYIVPIAAEDFYKNAKTYSTRMGQYFARDTFGNIYMTSMGGPGNPPEFKVFNANLNSADIHCKHKPPQDKNNFKKTITFGEETFDSNAIYCIIGSKIYSYHLK